MTGQSSIRLALPAALLISSAAWADAASAQASLGIGALQNASAYRNDVGKRFTFVCPASTGAGAAIYGTTVYTDSSPICAAAIHAGVLKSGQIGVVSIVIGSAATAFEGSTQNGVTSARYGRWDWTYTFAKDTVPATITWATTWSNIPKEFADAVAVTCPAGGKAGALLWGTDIYVGDSGICVAAVHAGVITQETGGTVSVARAPAQKQYPGSDRHKVVSRSWGSSAEAFSVAAVGSAAVQAATAAVSGAGTTSLQAAGLANVRQVTNPEPAAAGPPPATLVNPLAPPDALSRAPATPAQTTTGAASSGGGSAAPPRVPAPRTVVLGGFTLAGIQAPSVPNVAPRTVQLAGFELLGVTPPSTPTNVAPRSIALSGFTFSGLSSP